jgi:DNA-binding GntR family transcriptional regulator
MSDNRSASNGTLDLKSVEESVYEAIRDKIVRSECGPGTHLYLATLAAELGVSTMPVRGAILRLTGEGLVHSLPRRGAIVAPFSFPEFEELQELRCGIEGVAARVGAKHVTPKDLRRMRAILAEYEKPHTLDEYLSLEWEAYLCCYGASGRDRTMRLILEYGRLAERYVRVAVGSQFDREHSSLLLGRLIDACEAQDPVLAESAVTDGLLMHLELVRGTLADTNEKDRL